jgi:hypothetical protein
LNAFLNNSNRRKYGLGLVGKLLDRKLKKDLTNEERKAIDHMDDYRPYFTYWITSGLVLVTSLSLQQVDYFEPENFWFGPRAVSFV